MGLETLASRRPPRLFDRLSEREREREKREEDDVKGRPAAKQTRDRLLRTASFRTQQQA